MKGYRKVITLLSILMAICSKNLTAAPTNKRSMMQGCLKIEGPDQKVPEFRILFNGMETKNNREGLFAFPLSGIKNNRATEVYKLVICKSLDQNFETANTIQTVALPEGERSRIITLDCIENEDGTLLCESESCKEMADGSLTCQAKKPMKARSIDMESSIIILMDPDNIERIEPWNVKLAANFTKLPRIVIKNKSKKELTNASAESLLASLDLRPFHEPIYGKKVREDKIKRAVLP